MTKLFLDDIRMPKDDTWDIVRSYDEFVAYIKANGIPDIISFDHDLVGEHYKSLFKDPKKHILEEGFIEKTGYDCVKWLVKNDYKIKQYACHSMNPIGKKNIMCLLDNWYDYSGGIR